MLVRSPSDLGAVVRDRRKQLKLDQAAFAKKIGVSRQWVIEVEKGHARAELGLVLRAIDALNIQLDANTGQASPVKSRRASPVDIDAIISRARKTKP
jgi:HTH-type transcriptional regulator / antitoxin HipB